MTENNAILDKKLLDIESVASLMGISINTIYSWVNQRKIPHIKVGRLLRFRPETIQKWIEEREIAVNAF